MSARPALPTSAVVNPLDISFTDKATHVYVKVEDPGALCPRFEGPYKITDRPTRSTLQVRLGSFVDGSPRLQVYNWESCKIAHLRPGAQEAERPKLGRPAAVPDAAPTPTSEGPDPSEKQATRLSSRLITTETQAVSAPSRARNNTRPARSSRNQNPSYVDYIALPA